MATLNVSLSDPMKDRVEARARMGRYSNASDSVCDLIRRDQERADTVAEIQHLITEGLESGISDRSVAQVLDFARRHARPSQGSWTYRKTRRCDLDIIAF